MCKQANNFANTTRAEIKAKGTHTHTHTLVFVFIVQCVTRACVCVVWQRQRGRPRTIAIRNPPRRRGSISRQTHDINALGYNLNERERWNEKDKRTNNVCLTVCVFDVI